MSCVTCHLSGVTFQVSGVTCLVSYVFFLVKLVGGGSVINRAYPVQFKQHLSLLKTKTLTSIPSHGSVCVFYRSLSKSLSIVFSLISYRIQPYLSCPRAENQSVERRPRRGMVVGAKRQDRTGQGRSSRSKARGRAVTGAAKTASSSMSLPVQKKQEV